MHDRFRRVAVRTAAVAGSPWAFCTALAVVLLWAACGPLFGFSETWQLVINTGTTIVTFLMVFLIQSAQNRDSSALHLKLDELVHAVQGARDAVAAAEQLSDDQLEALRTDAGSAL